MRLEPRSGTSVTLLFFFPALAVFLSFLIVAFLVLLSGASPFSVFYRSAVVFGFGLRNSASRLHSGQSAELASCITKS